MPEPDDFDFIVTPDVGAMALRVANQSMSTQAMNSEEIQAQLMSLLLGPVGLYEGLRVAAQAHAA